VAAAQLKLTAALAEESRSRATRMRQRFYLDAPGWYQDGDGSAHLAAVADAVWRQQAIEVRYESWREVVDRRLEPYGLVLKAGKWYAVARADRGVCTFRVSQIRALTVLPDGFDWPDGFDLTAFWHEHIAAFRARLYRGEALVRIAPTALDRVSHLMGRTVIEAINASVADGGTQPDGWILARVPIESERHAEAEFLRLGASVEVLEPASLRARMAATVADLAAVYADSV
jgi:predicted DNA-binding transcriptional regulator YafY